jgi:hypothetical protein
MKKLSLAAVAALIALPAGAQTYKPEYKLSTVVGKPFPWGIAGERWGELVKEKTQGRINIKMYPGAQLVGGDQTKEFTALRQGAIDIAIGSTINWSPQVKELNIFSMPFLMPDYKAIDALTGGEVGKDLFKLLATKDVVPLAWGENGFREITNSKHAIKGPDDLKGLKIRVVGSPLFLDTFTALGANLRRQRAGLEVLEEGGPGRRSRCRRAGRQGEHRPRPQGDQRRRRERHQGDRGPRRHSDAPQRLRPEEIPGGDEVRLRQVEGPDRQRPRRQGRSRRRQALGENRGQSRLPA